MISILKWTNMTCHMPIGNWPLRKWQRCGHVYNKWVQSILKHVQGRSLSILASKINPRVKVLDYMHECQAWSSNKTLISRDPQCYLSLDKAFKFSQLSIFNSIKLTKRISPSVNFARCLSRVNTHYTTWECYDIGDDWCILIRETYQSTADQGIKFLSTSNLFTLNDLDSVTKGQ